MVFDALQAKALEGFNKFYKYDQPSINWRASSTWRGQEREIKEKQK